MDESQPKDVEQLLRDHDLLSLFHDLTFREKVTKVVRGLHAPKESGEYKYAKLQVIRLSAPISAVVAPLALVGLMILFEGISDVADRGVEVQIMEPEALDKLEEIEKPEDEPIPPPEPMDMPNLQPNAVTDVATPTPAADFSPQPAPFDSVAIVKSPVIMKGIFGSRTPGMRGQALAAYGGSGITEGAVLRALRWLKKCQGENGSWTAASGAAGGGAGGAHGESMTSFALLAYLAHGETPSSEEFGPTVEKGIQWLVSRQNGGNGRWTGSYQHQIATYALAEAYALTKVPTLKESAEKGLDVIVRGQNPAGGWDYGLSPCDRNDTSVMAWCAQALKAAKMAGLENSGLDDCMKKGIDGFKGNASPTGGFGYTGPGAGGLTGAGCLSMQFLGAAKAKETLLGLQYIVANRSTFQWQGCSWKSIYYWYYETQTRFHAGGKIWEDWNKLFALDLVKAQTVLKGAGADGKDIGYWTTAGGGAADAENKGEGDAHGLVMNTTLCTLMLEVYYRYLPTFKSAKIMEGQDDVAAPADTGDIQVDIQL